MNLVNNDISKIACLAMKKYDCVGLLHFISGQYGTIMHFMRRPDFFKGGG